MTRATLEPTLMDTGTRIEAATDEALLERLGKEGSMGALEELIRRYQHMAYRVAFARCGQRDLAEDATQDAFVELARKSGRPVPTEFRPWFLGLVHNMARRRMRTERRTSTRERSARYKEEAGDVSERRQAAQAPSVDRETRQALSEALHGLGEDLRVPLVLCFMEGLSQEEAGKVVGVSQPMIARRIARALDVLRARLALRGVAASALALPALILKDTSLLPAPLHLNKSLSAEMLIRLAKAGASESLRRSPLVPWFTVRRLALAALLPMVAASVWWLGFRHDPETEPSAGTPPEAGYKQVSAPSPEAPLRTWHYDFAKEAPSAFFEWSGRVYYRKSELKREGGLYMGGPDAPVPGAILLPDLKLRKPVKVTLQVLPEKPQKYFLRSEWFDQGRNWPMKVWVISKDFENKMEVGDPLEWTFYVLDRNIVYLSRLGNVGTVSEAELPPMGARLGLVIQNLLVKSLVIEEVELKQIPPALQEAYWRPLIETQPPSFNRKFDGADIDWQSADSIPLTEPKAKP